MKPFYKGICVLFVFTFTLHGKSFAQAKGIAGQEVKFIKLYSKLLSFSNGNYDSTSFYSNRFEKEFMLFLKNNPATLDYPFKSLIDSSCSVITSSDGNFRVYSWDTWTGGTMHIFQKVYQWKAGGKVFIKAPKNEDGDGGSFCSKLFTININDKPYYLVVSNGIYSTKDAMQSIAAFNIENNKLTDTVKLFKTKTKKLNSIEVNFDFFSVVDRPERPLELITYDDKQKIVYIPVVDNKNQVTKRNILYQLKDGYFEFIGIETGM